MTKIVADMNRILWGAPALLLILGVGIGLSFRLGFPQLRFFPMAARALARKIGCRGDSSFRSLCTALGATVGTGNLVGVAGAICIGGPGAVFWMWISGFLGMATKFAEAVLAVRYRETSAEGYLAGPMYMIRKGLGCRALACGYCLFGLLASFGVGNAAQINAVITEIMIPFRRLNGVTHAMTNVSLFVTNGKIFPPSATIVSIGR